MIKEDVIFIHKETGNFVEYSNINGLSENQHWAVILTPFNIKPYSGEEDTIPSSQPIKYYTIFEILTHEDFEMFNVKLERLPEKYQEKLEVRLRWNR